MDKLCVQTIVSGLISVLASRYWLSVVIKCRFTRRLVEAIGWIKG